MSYDVGMYQYIARSECYIGPLVVPVMDMPNYNKAG